MHELVYAENHDKEGKPYNFEKRVGNACVSDDVPTTIEDYGLFGASVLKGTGLSEEICKDMTRPQAIIREYGAF